MPHTLNGNYHLKAYFVCACSISSIIFILFINTKYYIYIYELFINVSKYFSLVLFDCLFVWVGANWQLSLSLSISFVQHSTYFLFLKYYPLPLNLKMIHKMTIPFTNFVEPQLLTPHTHSDTQTHNCWDNSFRRRHRLLPIVVWTTINTSVELVHFVCANFIQL